MSVAHFTEWMPIRIYWPDNRPAVDWCHMGNLRFTDPFFSSTIDRVLRQPFSQLFRRYTPIETLCELENSDPGLPPTGFIFHMSRCGSTLAAQMLASLPQNIVISEAEPIDAILNARFRNPSITDEQRILWLRGLISAFGRPRQNSEEHFFIKFDSWHTLDLALILRAFPTVPWIFLYRDPLEVMLSHQYMPGAQMVPGMVGPGRETVAEILTQMSLADYGARTLARICEAAIEQRNSNGLFVNYRQLPAAISLLLENHFGVIPSEADLARMSKAVEFDAKSPGVPFDPGWAKKRCRTKEETITASAKWLSPVYERLEALCWQAGDEAVVPAEPTVTLQAAQG
jgi:hypothetical protein